MCGVFCGGGYGCGGATMVVAQFGIMGIGRGLLALGKYGKNKNEVCIVTNLVGVLG